MSSNSNGGCTVGRYVWVVIHEKLPTYSMYLHTTPYSEPIETVNSTIVSIHKSCDSAEAKARRYFFHELGYTDSGDSEKMVGYHYNAVDNDGDAGTWDEQVYVEQVEVSK